jgi:hypothetical protein
VAPVRWRREPCRRGKGGIPLLGSVAERGALNAVDPVPRRVADGRALGHWIADAVLRPTLDLSERFAVSSGYRTWR